MVVQRLKDDLESEHWRFSGVEDTVDDGPPRKCDIRQVHLKWDAACSLCLLPVVEDLSVSPHSPDRICGPVIQLVPQVPSRYFHGSLEPLIQVVRFRGVSRSGLAPHSSLEPTVQARTRVTGPSLMSPDIRHNVMLINDDGH